MANRINQRAEAWFRTARILLSLACAAAFLSVIACSGGGQSAFEAERPLRIGLLIDYTGPLGNLGEPTEEGARFALELINAAGGVGRRKVDLFTADGATDPEVSVRAARRLIEEKEVDIIIGPLGSGAALAVAQKVSLEAQVPIICPSATNPNLTALTDDGLIFRTCLSDSAQGPALAQIAEEQGFERVAVLYRNDPYGEGLNASFSAAFEGEITGAAAIEPYEQSYLDQLVEVTTGSPEALAALTFSAEGEVFIAEALDRGLVSNFVFADAMAHEYLIDSIGAERLEGVRGTLPRGGGGISPELVQEWTDDFTSRFGKAPSGLSQAVYDIIICICLAAEHARSIESVALRDTFPIVTGGDGAKVTAVGAEAVRDALAKVRVGKDVNYEGLSCSMDLTPQGDLATGVVEIFEISDGAFNRIGELPIEASTTTVERTGG